MDEPKEKNEEAVTALPKRPWFLTLVCLFSFVFFGFIAVLFLVALLYSGRVTEIVNKYTPENLETKSMMTFFLLGAFLLHAAAFAGAVMIWKMKRKGYLLFGISALIIAASQLYLSKISYTTTAVYILLLICAGIFIKRMR